MKEKAKQIFILACLALVLSAPARGDFSVDEVSENLDEISVIVFPLLVEPGAFENTEEQTGSFYDDPDSRYLRCPSPVLEKAVRFYLSRVSQKGLTDGGSR